MLWMGIWVHTYTVKPLQIGVNFRKIGVGLSPSDVVMSWLRLQTSVDCIVHIICTSLLVNLGFSENTPF
jgi:hypothetical protein